MVVQCPQCESGILFDESDFGGLAQMEVQCIKCQSIFFVKAPPTEPVGPSKAPAQLKGSETVTVVAERTKLPLGKRVSLVVMQGLMRGESFRLTKPEITIGRLGADIVLDDPEVSATHCALELRGDGVVLTDMGSTNGTFVNEEPIKRAQIKHLDEFRIGRTTLMFTVTREE